MIDQQPRAETLPERVARALREAIDRGDYPTGAILPSEKAIAAQLGVGANAVREGLAYLVAEARVRSTNGRGTLVLPPPVPQHVITLDPVDPYRDLTPSPMDTPRPSRGAADPRTAALLGIPHREYVFVLDQPYIHPTGALVRARRILPAISMDGIDKAPDLFGPRAPIIKALTRAHGPLRHTARCGAAVPDTEDRAQLKITAPGPVVAYAAMITQAADGRGLMLDTLHVRADEAEYAPPPAK
jgi:DNA-binding GntR family transcriptional regulator